MSTLFLLLLRTKKINAVKKNATADGYVGNIKGRIAVSREVDVNEVDHMPTREAVRDVAQNPSANEAKDALRCGFLEIQLHPE